MEIKSKSVHNSYLEIKLELGNGKITEDVSVFKDGKWRVPESIIEQLISTANECSRFNDVSDVNFVRSVFDAFLSDSEKEEFLIGLEK